MTHTELLPFLRVFAGRYVDPDSHVLWVEALFWIIALIVSLLLLSTKPRILGRIEAAWRSAGRYRLALVIAPGLIAISLRLALLPLMPMPTPAIHDEFSYILGAETFAAGRLTNPTPAAWQHFESFHINMRPTYHSMYPPAQFLFPALGLVLANNAWIGVLLGVGIMCSAITWMLLGWMPPRWALLGGVWAAFRFGIFSYWVNSYWGGAMAAFAGALVLGAFIRIVRERKTKGAILLALGLFLLANSRPVEGLLFSLPMIIFLLAWAVRHKPMVRRQITARVVMPLVFLLLAGAAWMLYYNFRTTGKAAVMPYMLNYGEYHISKPFLGETRNPIPSYRHDSMRRFYVIHELPDYIDSQSGWGMRWLLERNITIFYLFFLCPISLLMLAGWLFMLRNPHERVLALAAVGTSIPTIMGLWPPHGHYAAPALCAFIATALAGLRVLRTWKVCGARLGLMLSRATVILLGCLLLGDAGAKALNPFEIDFNASQGISLPVERARIESQLNRAGGRHIVIVHYEPTDIPSREWVANKPDLNSAKIIWARDMGPGANEDLLRAYPGRHVWYSNRLDALHQLLPYSSQPALQANFRETGPTLPGK